METAVVTIKGQIVIPVKTRRRLGIKKGTKVAIMEDQHGFTVRPLDKKYFEQFAGILPGKGKATRALLEERRKDKEREDNRS
jgi:AbrB family looped-hinge helix DNA binding protein